MTIDPGPELAVPSLPPKQETFVAAIGTVSTGGSLIPTQKVAVQELASVTVTQCIPSGKLTARESV